MFKNSVNKRYVPKLRFKGFEENWIQSDLQSLETNKYKIENSNLFLDAKAIMKQNYLLWNGEIHKNAPEDSIIFIKDGSNCGTYFYSKNSVKIASTCEYLKFLYSNDFFFHLLDKNKKNIRNSLITGNAIPHIYKKNLLSLHFKFSANELEREKISKFLNLLDKQISLLENKLKLTETLSKFNIANFFKKTSKIYNFINFKKIVILNKNKNKSNHQYDVATISNKFGFIRQKEYFGDKTNVASENKKNYYIIDKKSFGFNPARINVGSFGYYNKNEKLLISPIYVSFKINNEIFHDEIIEAYSKTYFFKQNIAKWQTGSVRKSINANDFLNFTIPLIPLKIQNLFVNKKNLLEKHILCLNKKIETLKQRKMFYLENLFI